jgi:hypothetical protein
MRQGWPEAAANPGQWPVAFQESRRWCFLTMRPGDEPVRSLVEAFLDTWQLDSTSTDRPKKRSMHSSEPQQSGAPLWNQKVTEWRLSAAFARRRISRLR